MNKIKLESFRFIDDFKISIPYLLIVIAFDETDPIAIMIAILFATILGAPWSLLIGITLAHMHFLEPFFYNFFTWQAGSRLGDSSSMFGIFHFANLIAVHINGCILFSLIRDIKSLRKP